MFFKISYYCVCKWRVPCKAALAEGIPSINIYNNKNNNNNNKNNNNNNNNIIIRVYSGPYMSNALNFPKTFHIQLGYLLFVISSLNCFLNAENS